MFFTAFKEASALHLSLMNDLTLVGMKLSGQENMLFFGVGAIHCNNMRSNGIYKSIVSEMKRVEGMYMRVFIFNKYIDI
jgi:hypothetical protein